MTEGERNQVFWSYYQRDRFSNYDADL